jgi:hypothetical protein
MISRVVQSMKWIGGVRRVRDMLSLSDEDPETLHSVIQSRNMLKSIEERTATGGSISDVDFFEKFPIAIGLKPGSVPNSSLPFWT